ncbi:MAG: hypothetical protein ABII63_01995 [Pseudomonadota bacterium]
MLKRSFIPAALLFAVAPLALAAEQTNNCRLKHGSMVILDAVTCTQEGGTVVAPSAAPRVEGGKSVPVKLSDDSKLAAAQSKVAELLMKQVIDSDPKKRMPEWIQRTVMFDGCRLWVEEEMEVEYSKTFSSRKHFKVSSRVDMSKIAPEAFSELGKVTSYGGGMEVYAENIEEPVLSKGNNLSVSIQQQRDGSYSRYSASASSVFWDAPNADLRMADVYGYPKDKLESGAETDTVRLLFLMNTPVEITALHDALGALRAVCQP